MTPPEQVQSVEQQARDIEPMLKQAGWALSLGAIAAVIEALDTMYGPPPAHETLPVERSAVSDARLQTMIDKPSGRDRHAALLELQRWRKANELKAGEERS